jgi:flagellar motor switch protein FliM
MSEDQVEAAEVEDEVIDPDQEAMLAEWEAMAEEEVESEGGGEEMRIGSSRVLDQGEIDSLLGINGDDAGDGDRSGIQAILNSSLVSYERLPMLEVVFDRLVRMMSTSLRNFTSDNVEVSLDSINSARFCDYINSIPLPAMISVFKAEEWDNFGLLTIDSALIYSIVDVLLGGRRGTAAMRIEGRPFTTIERNLVQRLVHLVLADLSAAFDPLSPTTFRFDRLETNPRFATIARAANATVVVRLRIDMEDRGGHIEMMLPYATLEPIRELLLQMFMGEKFGRDSIWEGHLSNELWRTEIDIDAVLERFDVPLSAVMKWRPGFHLPLAIMRDSLIKLECSGIPLFKGEMGRSSGRVAIRVAEPIRRIGEGDQLP